MFFCEQKNQKTSTLVRPHNSTSAPTIFVDTRLFCSTFVPMSNLASHLAAILTGLQKAIAVFAADPSRTAFLVFVWTRVGRMSKRFQRLYTHWQNGTLPKPGAPRPGRTRAARAPEPFRFPGKSGWLVGLHGYTIVASASQFRHWLTTPEAVAFLAAAPQARRILNPLGRMLGVKLDMPYGIPLLPPPAAAEPDPAPAPPAPHPQPTPIVGHSPLPPSPPPTPDLPTPPKIFSTV